MSDLLSFFSSISGLNLGNIGGLAMLMAYLNPLFVQKGLRKNARSADR